MPTYKFNFKASPADKRDYTVRTTNTLDNKSTLVDLSNYCSSVKDQGALGSCTAFAAIGLVEFLYNKFEKKIDDLLSERFLYYVTRVDIEKTSPNDDSGAYLRDTLQAMIKYGVSTEKSFPYNTRLYYQKPDEKVYSEALNYQVQTYASIKGNGNELLQTIKKLLQGGSPFIGGVTCFQNFLMDKKGVIPQPSGKIIGGHALLFIGYDDKKSLIKFKNSWGKNWGDLGYGYLSYSYFLSGLVSDLWTISGVEYQNVVFDITIPKKRIDAFNNRLNAILSKLNETTNSDTVIQEIRQNKANLLPEDITELTIIARRFAENIAMARNKLFSN